MDTDTLSETLEAVMAGYAGQDLNGYSYLTRSANRQVFPGSSHVQLAAQLVPGDGFATPDLLLAVLDARDLGVA